MDVLKIALATTTAFVVVVFGFLGWAIWQEVTVGHPARVAACASKGWTYSSQTKSHGKYSETWSYCVTDDGTIKELPR